MQQQENGRLEKEMFVNIRKLAALDIVFHGSWFILAEFATGVILCGGFGVFSLVAFFSSPGHSLFIAILGILLLCVALNYVPLLLYAISIVRRGSAQQEVAFELEYRDFYARKYTLQSLLLMLPFVVLVLAIYQEVKHQIEK